jgi:hypothetical protein
VISSGSRATATEGSRHKRASGQSQRSGSEIRIFVLTCPGVAGSRSMTAHGGVGLAHASDRPDSHRTSTDRGDQWRRLGPRNTRGPTCIPGSRGSRGWPASLAAGTMGACVAHSRSSPSPRRWRRLPSPTASPRQTPTTRRRRLPRWHPRRNDRSRANTDDVEYATTASIDRRRPDTRRRLTSAALRSVPVATPPRAAPSSPPVNLGPEISPRPRLQLSAGLVLGPHAVGEADCQSSERLRRVSAPRQSSSAPA